MAAAHDEMSAGLFALAQTRLIRLARDRPDEPEIAYQLGYCERARGKMTPRSRIGRAYRPTRRGPRRGDRVSPRQPCRWAELPNPSES